MQSILLSPYSKPLRTGKVNPKSYPYWIDLCALLHERGYTLKQLVYGGEIALSGVGDVQTYTKLAEVIAALQTVDTYISVDNFLPHLAHYYKKYGVVLWGKSDPTLFGYAENINLLKDAKFLRKRQFDIWEAESYDESVFVEPKIVVDSLSKFAFSKS